MSRRASHICFVERQNKIKTAELCSVPIYIWGKSGVLAYYGPKIGHFDHIFGNMDFELVLPDIYILSIREKPIWKFIGPKLTILFNSKNHKNGHISKCSNFFDHIMAFLFTPEKYLDLNPLA